MAAGADVNVPHKNGLTLLQTVTQKGHLEVAVYLVTADVNVAEKNGFTPMHSAADDGKLEVAMYLVSAGADVNAAEKERLHAAAFCCACGPNKGILRRRSISRQLVQM